MSGRRPPRVPTASEAAQIRAVLALDVTRENELIRERALEIATECADGPLDRDVPGLAAELAGLVAAFEADPLPDGRHRASPAATARDVARDALTLARRVDSAA